MTENRKICSKCKESKPFSEYHKAGSRSKHGIQSQCKSCVSEYGKKYRIKLQIRAFLIRKKKEAKKTYPIQKKCLGCKKKKFIKDFVCRGEKAKAKDGTLRFSARCRDCENLRHLEFREKNKKRLNAEARKRMDRFRTEHPEIFRQNRLRSRKKQRENLDDGYIKRLICEKSKTGLKWDQVPQELIKTYREIIILKRLIKRKDHHGNSRDA